MIRDTICALRERSGYFRSELTEREVRMIYELLEYFCQTKGGVPHKIFLQAGNEGRAFFSD